MEQDGFDLTRCCVVERGDQVVELGVVLVDPFGAELRLDAGKPHLGLVGPELREFQSDRLYSLLLLLLRSRSCRCEVLEGLSDALDVCCFKRHDAGVP